MINLIKRFIDWLGAQSLKDLLFPRYYAINIDKIAGLIIIAIAIVGLSQVLRSIWDHYWQKQSIIEGNELQLNNLIDDGTDQVLAENGNNLYLLFQPIIATILALVALIIMVAVVRRSFGLITGMTLFNRDSYAKR
jgi:hypothetical protein